jgi:serine protease Do
MPRTSRYAAGLIVALLVSLCAWIPAATTAPTTLPVPAPKTTPTTRPSLKTTLDNLADLRALQARVEEVVTRVRPAVVGVRVGRGQGSGVIVTADGYVLTAGHVVEKPNANVTIILGDGKLVKAKSLGVNHAIDSGLVKITDPAPAGGKWPFVEMGFSGQVLKGQWCVAMGHPGGFKLGRTPPLRLGRILEVRGNGLRTDCTLVGGDSGGPLFDLDGRVIGIHSRIGSTVNDNLHVPVDTFRDTWDRLTKSDEWGKPLFASTKPYFGIEEDDTTSNCRVGAVFPDSPAQRAGLQPGDVITSFGGEPIANFGELIKQVNSHVPNQKVAVEVQRGGKTLTFQVKIGHLPSK